MQKYLANLIKINGLMTVAQFMNEALFHPLYGYYNQKNPFGRNGDFITAPEISQVFGELIGAYLAGIWAQKKQKINLVEMGAGRGTLMKDLLCANPEFAAQINIHIIEISPRLQEIQKENLREFKINWWENFNDFYAANSDLPIYFIANELFDCLPINQFVKTANGWREKLVGLNEQGNLDYILSNYPADKSIDQMAAGAGLGAVFEYSQAAENLIAELSLAIKKTGGIGIIIDYGYIKNEFKNSLQALKNHQYCDALENAGNCDITALVNFQQLKNAAQKNTKISLVTQKEFLENLGIELRQQKLITQNPTKQTEINSAINRLTDSAQMGELFKCLIFWAE
jgi:NADH dehydrogenase [ubiquinone] 1 alpha subcomplex assembly factor 7